MKTFDITRAWITVAGLAVAACTSPASTSDAESDAERGGESATARPVEKDLALAWDLRSRMIAADDLVGRERALPTTWYAAVEAGFERTTIADALAIENRRSDWRMVSMRTDPPPFPWTV
jgi:hypothetical protein